MFSAVSKLGFTVSGIAVAAATVYAFGTGDRDGFALLMFTAAVFLAVAVGAFYTVGPTELAIEVAETEPRSSVTPTAGPAASIWPLGVAAAVTLVVVAMAAGAWFLIAGILLLVVAGAVWYSQAWREHPSWTPAMTERLNQRFVVPFGLPGLTIALVGLGAVSFSRIFLATSKDVAPIIATVAAILVLGAAFWIANSERAGRTAISVLAAVAGVAVIASGVIGAVAGEREFHEIGGVEVGIRNSAFTQSEYEIPAGENVVIVLRNNDISSPHNLAVYTEPGGRALFQGEAVTGPRITTYTVKIDEPGTYHLQSDERPEQVTATLKVVESGGHGGGHGESEKGSDDHGSSDDH